ncbi:hypothetical protein ACFWXO_37905 [Kitasatospora sp. NPDC059088]
MSWWPRWSPPWTNLHLVEERGMWVVRLPRALAREASCSAWHAA